MHCSQLIRDYIANVYIAKNVLIYRNSSLETCIHINHFFLRCTRNNKVASCFARDAPFLPERFLGIVHTTQRIITPTQNAWRHDERGSSSQTQRNDIIIYPSAMNTRRIECHNSTRIHAVKIFECFAEALFEMCSAVSIIFCWITSLIKKQTLDCIREYTYIMYICVYMYVETILQSYKETTNINKLFFIPMNIF